MTSSEYEYTNTSLTNIDYSRHYTYGQYIPGGPTYYYSTINHDSNNLNAWRATNTYPDQQERWANGWHVNAGPNH